MRAFSRSEHAALTCAHPAARLSIVILRRHAVKPYAHPRGFGPTAGLLLQPDPIPFVPQPLMKSSCLTLIALAALTPLAALANVLGGTDAAKWKPGAVPKPWQTTATEKDITVQVTRIDKTNWIELKDGSAEKAANVRQQFAPVVAGRLLLRVMLAPDNDGDLGIYLFDGTSSGGADRVVDIKSNKRGMLRLGTRGERIDTGLILKPGVPESIFVDFYPEGQGTTLRIGRVDADGKPEILGENTFAKQAGAVNRLRITSDNAPVGAHFYVTDLRLLPVK